ncbi:MAG: CRISPR-associated endoribonuclease Cas6 [Lachnospiraceae bacterium]
MEINVLELQLKIFLLHDLKQEDALNEIASFIDETLSKQEEMRVFHRRNQYKNYSFCSFYPIAQEGVYQKEKVYSVLIRTIDRVIADYFMKNLPNHYNKMMKGLVCEVKKIPPHLIERVYTITPAIIKDSHGYWKEHLTFEQYEERIKINLIKKYNAFTENKIDEDFPLYHSIQILNKVPIKILYKGIHLLGDKLELHVSEHPTAQKLIYMSLGTGILESNARGNGFMNYQYYK